MAHELTIRKNGKAEMAYVGAKPWHNLGQELAAGADLETWKEAAGMDWNILSGPVKFNSDGLFPAYNVLYRSDDHAPLSIVSSKYKVVQPGEVLEFFKNLTTDYGFQLETAGVLFNGQKYWALARTGETAKIAKKDEMRGYVLLATSCDGSLKTTARHTSIRVVCNNTLELSARNRGSEVKVSHSSVFKAETVQTELGILEGGWNGFIESAQELAKVKITDKQAVDFVIKLMGDPSKPVEGQSRITDISKVLQLYKGQGRGADMVSANDTAWGIVNAVTEWGDYHKGKDQQRRLEYTWFYDVAQLKRKAFDMAVNDFVYQQAA